MSKTTKSLRKLLESSCRLASQMGGNGQTVLYNSRMQNLRTYREDDRWLLILLDVESSVCGCTFTASQLFALKWCRRSTTVLANEMQPNTWANTLNGQVRKADEARTRKEHQTSGRLFSRFDLAEGSSTSCLVKQWPRNFLSSRRVRRNVQCAREAASLNSNAADNAKQTKSTSLRRRGREAGAQLGGDAFGGSFQNTQRDKQRAGVRKEYAAD
jgi:hypothetical protein